jgi:hypothetical protein
MYHDLRVEDIQPIKTMRDNCAKYAVKREFNKSLECMFDLRSYMRQRKIHPSFFSNLVREILVITKDMSDDPLLLLDFEVYFQNHWRVH